MEGGPRIVWKRRTVLGILVVLPIIKPVIKKKHTRFRKLAHEIYDLLNNLAHRSQTLFVWSI
jgi:hypothetical protein